MIISTPFTIAESWNQPRYLSTDKGKNKHGTMEFYFTIEKNEIGLERWLSS